MPNAIFEQEDDVKVERPEKPDNPSKSGLANIVANAKITKTHKGAEFFLVVVSIVILALSLVIFMYGIGKRQTTTIEDTGNVYLETR